MSDTKCKPISFLWLMRLASLLRSWLVLLIVVLLFSMSRDFRHTFFTWNYLPNVFQQSARNTVLAVGMSFVIITGGIDLSVGSVLALSGVGLALSLAGQTPLWMSFICVTPLAACLGWAAHAKLARFTPFQRKAGCALAVVACEAICSALMTKGVSGGVHVEGAILLCLLIGAGCGVINGVVVSCARVPPFVVTLGMMSAARGMTLFATNGESVPALVPRFMSLGQGAPLVAIAVSAVAVGAFVFARLAAGRYMLSIGGNEQATHLSGVDVIQYKSLAYGACGFCAALAGVMVTAMFGQASTNAGSGAELEAIAAVVIGGASLNGGRGTVIGAMVGALTITVITAGLILVRVADTLQQVVLGAIIVLTVLIDQLSRAK